MCVRVYRLSFLLRVVFWKKVTPQDRKRRNDARCSDALLHSAGGDVISSHAHERFSFIRAEEVCSKSVITEKWATDLDLPNMAMDRMKNF